MTRGSNPTTSDESSLLHVATRSADDFARLYRRFAPLALRVSIGVLRDTHQAEEVVQEFFARLWSRPDRFDRERGSAAHWIAMSARSMAIERVRSAEACRRRDDGYHLLVDRQAQDDPVMGSILRGADHLAVRGVLARLPERQREAITLSFFDHLTHAEISDRLGVPLGTIKSRIRDGLGAMRTQLATAARSAA